LNHLVFQDIAADFVAGNPAHDAIVERLLEHEDSAIREVIVPSDFKVFAARR
jgi:hypothetical protein